MEIPPVPQDGVRRRVGLAVEYIVIIGQEGIIRRKALSFFLWSRSATRILAASEGRKAITLAGLVPAAINSTKSLYVSIMAFFEWRFVLASLQKGPKTSGAQMANVDFAAN